MSGHARTEGWLLNKRHPSSHVERSSKGRIYTAAMVAASLFVLGLSFVLATPTNAAPPPNAQQCNTNADGGQLCVSPTVNSTAGTVSVDLVGTNLSTGAVFTTLTVSGLPNQTDGSATTGLPATYTHTYTFTPPNGVATGTVTIQKKAASSDFLPISVDFAFQVTVQPAASGTATRNCTSGTVTGIVNATGLIRNGFYNLQYATTDLKDTTADATGNAQFAFKTTGVPAGAIQFMVDVQRPTSAATAPIPVTLTLNACTTASHPAPTNVTLTDRCPAFCSPNSRSTASSTTVVDACPQFCSASAGAGQNSGLANTGPHTTALLILGFGLLGLGVACVAVTRGRLIARHAR